MRRYLILAVAALAFFFTASAEARYPYWRPYGAYSGMRMNMGGGSYYNFGSTPYGPYSGMSLNMGGGNYYNSGSTPYGSYSGMSLNFGGGNRYNTGSFVPYAGRRFRPYRGGYGGYGAVGPYGYGFGGGY